MNIYNTFAASRLADDIYREAQRCERRGLDYVVSTAAIFDQVDDLYNQVEDISPEDKRQGTANYTTCEILLHLNDRRSPDARIAGHAKIAEALQNGTLVELVEEIINSR